MADKTSVDSDPEMLSMILEFAATPQTQVEFHIDLPVFCEQEIS